MDHITKPELRWQQFLHSTTLCILQSHNFQEDTDHSLCAKWPPAKRTNMKKLELCCIGSFLSRSTSFLCPAALFLDQPFFFFLSVSINCQLWLIWLSVRLIRCSHNESFSRKKREKENRYDTCLVDRSQHFRTPLVCDFVCCDHFGTIVVKMVFFSLFMIHLGKSEKNFPMQKIKTEQSKNKTLTHQ